MRNLTPWIEETFAGLGIPGMFLIAFLDSSLLSLPEVNDLILFFKSAGAGWWALGYAAAATLGSASGCSLLYTIGRTSGSALTRLTRPGRLDVARRLVQRYGAWSVLIPSVLPPPLPFKIFVLSAGVFGLPYPLFIRAILFGRSVRYFGEALAAMLIGDRAVSLFREHPYALAAVALAVLGVGVVIDFVVKRALRRRGVLQRGESL